MSKKKKKKKQVKKLISITKPVKKDEAFFIASELADEKQIEDEVLGKATKTMVYEYMNEDGDVVHGLAYQGVREAVRVINRMKGSGHRIQVSDKPPVFSDRTQQGVEGIEVQIYAQDIESGGGYWGLKFEPWQKVVTDNIHGGSRTEYNKFAKEIALSKAERNSLFKLLPLEIIDKMIAKFASDEKKIAKIEAPKTETIKIEPKKSDDNKMYRASLARVAELKENKKALKDALKKVDNMPINSKQRGQIRRKINIYLKKIK